ncbi:DUF3800 domain-containing protein [Patescibacteria group bacterium]|nr:DUF3800 domain-containing protein [Patescibacteria group bacterium]MBU4162071.1 DUF3800 domain-containing protein [Patescibacteria group bacterium]
MSTNIRNYIFVDESGDPGKIHKIDSSGNKIYTGASLFYILSAVCLNSRELFLLENKILEIKNKHGFRNEIKSTIIPLILYKDLLKMINKLDIKIFYRLIDKRKYKGTFAVKGDKRLHNVFDEYNLAKLVCFAVKKCDMTGVEVVIDRTDRRLLDGNFENFNDYLKGKINTKTIERIKHVTHVNSEYVNAMQLSDLVSGAIKDSFTKKNPYLKKIMEKRLLKKIY